MKDNPTIIHISTKFIKLDSFLKFCGVSMTGGEAKLLIADGLVKVDGEVCTMRGKKLRPGMTVEIEGEDKIFGVESA